MFREDKATQMAARFLQLSKGQMPYLKLIKLLYMADKQMLLTRGKPIVYDAWVSMKKGPVLSTTYDLIKQNDGSTYWSRHIRTKGYDALLESDPGTDNLSRAEEHIIEAVFAQYGHVDKWDLVELTHDFPEWKNPGNSSCPISYETVLRLAGIPADSIVDILDNIDARNDFEAALGIL